MNKQAYFKMMGLVKKAGWSDQQLTRFGVPRDQFEQYRNKYYYSPAFRSAGERSLRLHLRSKGIYPPGAGRPGDVQQLPNGTLRLTAQGRARHMNNTKATPSSPSAQQVTNTKPAAPVVKYDQEWISDQASEY